MGSLPTTVTDGKPFLTLICLAAILDPPRDECVPHGPLNWRCAPAPDVVEGMRREESGSVGTRHWSFGRAGPGPPAIREAHAAGISVKMITGDHAQTALAIARVLDIVRSGGRGLRDS